MTRLYAEDQYKTGPSYYTVTCYVEGLCMDGSWYGPNTTWRFANEEDAKDFAASLEAGTARFTKDKHEHDRVRVDVERELLLVPEDYNDRQFEFIDSIWKAYGDYCLPDYMWDGIQRYLLYGTEPGSFLMAMLRNDLQQTVSVADTENREALATWAMFLYNEVPSVCWGSEPDVELWMDSGGWVGRYGNEDSRTVS